MAMIDGILRDVRLAVRRAGRHGAFSGVVVACVALGVGASAGVYSVVRPVLLSPLPFDEPDRLVRIAAFTTNRTDPDERYWMSWIPTERVLENQQSLEGLGGFYQTDVDVAGADGAERLPGARTIPGSFDALRVRPLVGRTLRLDDMRAGLRTALISEELWNRRYGRDPSVVGQSITLDERPHEIVGVVPSRYGFPGRVDIWTAYQPDDYSFAEQRGNGVLQVFGRLADGSTAADLDRDLDVAVRAIREFDPGFYAPWGIEWITLREGVVGNLERPLWTLLAGAGLVLVLAVANVVNLLLARSHAESWERSLRTALGAGRGRMLRQGLVEHLLLAGTGAALGTALAVAGARALLAVTPLNDPAFDRVGLTPSVVIVAAVLALVVAMVMSVITSGGGTATLARLRGSRGTGLGRAARRTQTSFVIGQVALSLVLLVGAALLGRSFANLQALDLGFDTDPLVAVRVSAPTSMLARENGANDFARELLTRAAALPGVIAVGATSGVPFDDANVGYNHSVEDFPPEDGAQRPLQPGWVVSAGYFPSMGIDLVRGRDFDERDRMDAPGVLIVNREFERRTWPGESALGKRIKRGTYDMDRPWLEVVGVVEDNLSGSISEAVRPNLYYPLSQSRGSYLAQLAYTMRVAGDPARIVPAFRAAVSEVSPSATVYRVSTGADIARVALGRPKFNGLIIGVFAAIGLTLAAAGVYGVTAYTVGRRTREFGLRVALGARPGHVQGLVLQHGMTVAAVGAGLGICGAAVLTRQIGDLLYGVDTGDVATYAVVTSLLVGTVLFASYVPARRATRVDPATVLRED